MSLCFFFFLIGWLVDWLCVCVCGGGGGICLSVCCFVLLKDGAGHFVLEGDFDLAYRWIDYVLIFCAKNTYKEKYIYNDC